MICLLAIVAIAFVSCNNDKDRRIKELEEKIDTLLEEKSEGEGETALVEKEKDIGGCVIDPTSTKGEFPATPTGENKGASVHAEEYVKCPICHGTTKDPRNFNYKCFGCGGRAIVETSRAKYLSSLDRSKWPYVETLYLDCPMCFGTGIIDGNQDLITATPCNYCDKTHKVDWETYQKLLGTKIDMMDHGLPVRFMPPFPESWY